MATSFGHRGVDQTGCSIHQALERVRPRRHLTELVLDGAEIGDWMAELPPILGILRGLGDRPTTSATAHRTQFEAAEVQGIERDLVSLADLAKEVLRGHS